MPPAERTPREGLFAPRLVILILCGIFAVRLLCGAVAPLAFDEAYYWLWSKHLAGGYYDHPPMIAFVIRLGTLITGDTEFGIRLVPVLLGIPATWAIWRSGTILFGDRQVGATSALYFNITMMVAFGLVLATIDAPLLAASAFVLFFLAKVIETERGGWWLAVGAAVGCALLSKYSALFFGVSILAWLLIAPQQRRWLSTAWPYLGGLVALLFFSPVLWWNAEHGWVSFLKQFGRAVPDGWTLKFLGEYILAQIGLATPFVFALGALAFWAFWRARGATRDVRVLLGALFWPLAIYFLWHSLHARVEGNWTAPVFPAFVVAAAAAAHRFDWTGTAATVADWSRQLAVPAGLAMIAFASIQGVFGIVPLGAADPTARQLAAGWRGLGPKIDALRLQENAGAVLATSYALTSWLAFYLPSRPPVVQVNERIRWVNAPEPDRSHFQGPLLYVCHRDCAEAALVRERYATVEEIAQLPRTRRGVEIEVYSVYRVRGLRGDPLDRSPPPELARTK
jgi:4-amino-4-deoxy-L-arabinose transferase-like glycosyltransferase